MNFLEKYKNQKLVNKAGYSGNFTQTESNPDSSLIVPILKRWRIVLLTFLLVCAVCIPTICLLVKPEYQATAAIRVAPVIPSILFGDGEGVPMYKNFMYTQADLIMSDDVIKSVTDNLGDKNLSFFTKPDISLRTIKKKLLNRETPAPMAILRRELQNKNMTVTPEDNTELIKISMKGTKRQEAKQIVDAFVRAYMTIIASNEAKGSDVKLKILRNEQNVLIEKLQRQRQAIREMAEEFGTETLSKRHEIMLERVAALQEKLTELEMRKIGLSIQRKLLKEPQGQAITPEELLKLRYDFINADLMVQMLTTTIVELDKDYIEAKGTLAPGNSKLRLKAKVLDTLKQRLEQRHEEIGHNFEKMVSGELAKSDNEELKKIESELEQNNVYQKHLHSILAQEDSETIQLGRKQLAIQDLHEQMKLTKELHEAVGKRIQEIRMERKRPARVSVAYYANTFPLPDKRLKYIAAVILAAMGLGVFLAVQRDKTDSSLHTPDDIVRRVGVRILGTTTCSDGIEDSYLHQHASDDYQAICANLGLFDGQGIPRKLLITSPCPREGKTTLAINLATSIARTGRRVLVIDGDLRKPDVARLLDLECKGNRLAELLSGRKLEEVVCSTSLPGLTVLTSGACKPSEIYRLITQSRTAKYIARLGEVYDNVIVDSPPVLVAPDALLWGKMVDAAIFTSFANYTESQDLREALERLKSINVKVLGAVLSNVSLNYNYSRYRYKYLESINGGKKRNSRNKGKKILLPMQK